MGGHALCCTRRRKENYVEAKAEKVVLAILGMKFFAHKIEGDFDGSLGHSTGIISPYEIVFTHLYV